VPNPAQIDPLHIAALIGSRICHDLISPIGAIGNGIELMMMDSAAAPTQEMALILESTGHANARIRFFRVAFGLCGADQRIGRAEAASIVADMTTGGRLNVDWSSPQDLARRDIKLVYLALLCLESALPVGGAICVEMGDNGWSLGATAARLRIDGPLWDGLQNPDLFGDVTPNQVHFPLLALEAARQHRRITMTQTEGHISLRF
jgi:histidine phosphotransferase ChpT